MEGAVWVPEDAIADPRAICHALAKLAKQGGARYKENCRVLGVHTENGAVKTVETDSGNINCEYFINCAGMVRIIELLFLLLDSFARYLKIDNMEVQVYIDPLSSLNLSNLTILLVGERIGPALQSTCTNSSLSS